MDSKESLDYSEEAAAHAVFSLYYHCEVEKMTRAAAGAKPRGRRGGKVGAVEPQAPPASTHVASVEHAITILNGAKLTPRLLKLLHFIVPVLVRSWKHPTTGVRARRGITKEHILSTARILHRHRKTLAGDRSRAPQVAYDPHMMGDLGKALSPRHSEKIRFEKAFRVIHQRPLGEYVEPQLRGRR